MKFLPKLYSATHLYNSQSALLQLRGNGNYAHARKHSMWGGDQEGDHPKVAAIREVREELGGMHGLERSAIPERYVAANLQFLGVYGLPLLASDPFCEPWTRQGYTHALNWIYTLGLEANMMQNIIAEARVRPRDFEGTPTRILLTELLVGSLDIPIAPGFGTVIRDFHLGESPQIIPISSIRNLDTRVEEQFALARALAE